MRSNWSRPSVAKLNGAYAALRRQYGSPTNAVQAIGWDACVDRVRDDILTLMADGRIITADTVGEALAADNGMTDENLRQQALVSFRDDPRILFTWGEPPARNTYCLRSHAKRGAAEQLRDT